MHPLLDDGPGLPDVRAGLYMYTHDMGEKGSWGLYGYSDTATAVLLSDA